MISEQQTFSGRDLREALAQVKQALGDEALILSTREVKQGMFGRALTEVVAQGPQQAPQSAPKLAKKPSYLASFDAALPDMREPTMDLPVKAAERIRSNEIDRLKPLEAEVRRLRAQLVSLVHIGDEKRGVKTWSAAEGKADTAFESHLISLGLDARLAGNWAKALKSEQRDMTMRLEKLVFDAVDTSGAIGEDSRLVMCVGPSGAGKTTTLAKWAAKAHLQEGKRVAIITLDAFRAGAVAQVRRYADLIGCPLSVAENMATLQLALDKHADKELIFVDTAGRDPSAQQELETVSNALRARDRNAEIHLALPAMFGPRSMRATLDIYRRLGANRLCFTKIDEVIDFAPVALVGASAGLPLSYWTTGQRIPDDVERISAQGFAERTLQALTSSLFGAQLHVEERFL